MNYKKGTCSKCGDTDVYLVKKTQSGRLCNDCNQARLAEKRGQVAAKPIKSSRKPTGESVSHIAIWNTRPHICTGCGKDLGNEPKPHYFSHTIRKSRQANLRNDLDNYTIKCLTCHTKWDFGTYEEKATLNDLAEMLEYIELHDIALWVKLTDGVAPYL